MRNFFRISAPLWADALVDGTFLFMQSYLTVVWKLSFTHAAAIVNIWGGTHRVLQVFFLFLADAYLGNFVTLVLSAIAFIVGIAFITMSIPPVLANSTGTCKKYESECIGHTQKVLFYTGMVLLAVGRAGRFATSTSFTREQRVGTTSDSSNSSIREPTEGGRDGTEKNYVLVFYAMITLTLLAGFFAFPYVKSWLLLFGVPAICTAVATLVFFSGWCSYVKNKPQGSPLTAVCRMFVAAALKRYLSIPADEYLYTGHDERLQSVPRTPSLRRLDKAAIIEEDQVKYNRWRLCSVAEVEVTKIAIRMVPIWTTFIVCAIVSSIGNTYVLEQATHMNPKMGKWKVPPQIPVLILMCPKAYFTEKAQLLTEMVVQRYAPRIGIAVAMVFSILCCIAAALVEIRRLKVIRRHDLLNKPDEMVPMSAYWLLFPMSLLGGLKAFFQSGVDGFYKNESPKSMRKYLCCFSEGVTGLGFMCSVLSVYVVGRTSEIGGKPNWFQYTLNGSRLDRYYWVLAVLSTVNLIAFIFADMGYYGYKIPEESEDNDDQEASDAESIYDLDYRKWWQFLSGEMNK